MSLYKYEEVIEQEKSGHNNTLNFSCMCELLEALGHDVRNQRGDFDTEKVVDIAYDLYGFLIFDPDDTNGIIVFYGGMFH